MSKYIIEDERKENLEDVTGKTKRNMRIRTIWRSTERRENRRKQRKGQLNEREREGSEMTEKEGLKNVCLKPKVVCHDCVCANWSLLYRSTHVTLKLRSLNPFSQNE